MKKNIVERNKNRIPEEWILTDEDECQYRRKIADSVYELYQVNERVPAGGCHDGKRFGIIHGTVHIADVDIREILEIYGGELIKECSDNEMLYGILAECEFEMRAGRGEGYISGRDMTWEDARDMLITMVSPNMTPGMPEPEISREDAALTRKMEELASAVNGFTIKSTGPIKKVQYGDVVAYISTDSNFCVEYDAVGHEYGEDLVPINLEGLQKVKAFVSLL